MNNIQNIQEEIVEINKELAQLAEEIGVAVEQRRQESIESLEEEVVVLEDLIKTLEEGGPGSGRRPGGGIRRRVDSATAKNQDWKDRIKDHAIDYAKRALDMHSTSNSSKENNRIKLANALANFSAFDDEIKPKSTLKNKHYDAYNVHASHLGDAFKRGSDSNDSLAKSLKGRLDKETPKKVDYHDFNKY